MVHSFGRYIPLWEREKAWLQKKVAAGHLASAIRKLRTVKPGVQIIFYSTYYPRQGDGAAHI